MSTLTLAQRSFRAIGTDATVVVTDPRKVEEAERILRGDIDAVDRACSRFRADSELEYLHANAGRSVRVSTLLFDTLEVAYMVAERTRGAVDPTVGNAIAALGYDRDFDEISEPSSPPVALGPVVGYFHIQLNRRLRSVRIPRGVRLDLGSSAKAYLADWAADHVATTLHVGALISIGGDVAVAGTPPEGGWPVGIAVDSSARGDDIDQVVAINRGGLASSSTAVRSWNAGGERVHHIIDPLTGSSAAAYWRLVSAAGATCVDANAVSTAAVVWGAAALERLPAFEQAVRLVRSDGHVVTIGAWPEGGGL